MRYIAFLIVFFFHLSAYANQISLNQKEIDFIKNNPKILLGVDTTWAPYVFVKNGKVIGGYSYDIINKINAIANINIVIKHGVWSDIVKQAKEDKLYGLLVSIASKKRANYFDFTDATVSIRNNIIVKEGNPKNIHSLKDLENKVIAIQKNNGFQLKRVQNIKGAKIVEFKDYSYFSEFLIKNKVDAIPMSDASLYTMRALNTSFNKILYLEDDSKTDIVYSINKKYPELTSIINKALALIPQKEKQILRKKWLFSPIIYKDIKKEIIHLDKKEKNFLDKKPRIIIGISKELIKKRKDINQLTIKVANQIYNLSDLRIDFKIASRKILFEDMKLKKIDGIVGDKKIYQKDKNFLCSQNYIYSDQNNYNFILPKKSEELLSIINKSLYTLYIQEEEKKFLNEEEKKYLFENNTIRFCINPLAPPLEELREGKHIGVSADIFKILSKSMNTTFELVKTKNWKESLQFFQEKKCDILPLVGKSKQRLEYMNFTDAIYSYSLVIVTKNNISFITNIKDLENKKIGIRKDYAINETIRNRYSNLTIVSVENNEEGMEKVKNNELFALVASLPSLGNLIQKKYLGELKISGVIDKNVPLFIGVSKDKEMLLQILNKAYKEIPVNVKQDITSKWNTFIYEDNLKYLTILKIVIAILCVFFIILLFFIYRQLLLKKLNKNLKQAIEKEKIKNELQTSKILHQSKLAQIGEMTNIIAHQWRQPLAAISATANNLVFKLTLEDKPNKEQLKDEINLISSYSQDLSTTINDFRSFFKNDKEPIQIEISDIVTKTIDIILPSLKEDNISLEVNCNIQPVYLKTYKNELQQALLSIIQNAKDAILNNTISEGKIIISTSKIDDYVNIEILDNGGGILDSIIEKIFDSNFTTKTKNGGTGIGLYISKMIIESHCEGKLTVKNQQEGAMFKISLPLN